MTIVKEIKATWNFDKGTGNIDFCHDGGGSFAGKGISSLEEIAAIQSIVKNSEIVHYDARTGELMIGDGGVQIVSK